MLYNKWSLIVILSPYDLVNKDTIQYILARIEGAWLQVVFSVA